MQRFFAGRSLYIAIATLFISGAVFLIYSALRPTAAPAVIATVDEGEVRHLVSVSGTIRAENTAELGFPVGGIIEKVHVRKGDVVATGTPLVTLSSDALRASVLEAQATLARARAEEAELRSGAGSETRAAAEATVRLKEEALTRTRADEAEKVAAARRALLSGGLTATADDTREDAPAPIISGSYLCEATGTYTLSFYNSASASGYSMKVSGLESGTFAASADQAIAFGVCGLRAQLSPGAYYHNSEWTVEIPNTKAAIYTTNQNAYELALSAAERAIAIAERELTLAKADASVTVAPAREEALARAVADTASAQAQLSRALANERDSTLLAPFSGTVVSVEAVAGETVASSPVVTILSSDRYELIARVPEIDVGKLTIGQRAEVIFDTSVNEPQSATVDFISPAAATIDGVAYYEARLTLDSFPPWLRSGLNADIDIITASQKGPRLPRRFVSDVDGEAVVAVMGRDGTTSSTTITVTLYGNDGFAAIVGLPIGQRVVAP